MTTRVNYNIITGQILRPNTERNFKSVGALPNPNKINDIGNKPYLNYLKLGDAKDKKEFQYSYIDKVQSPQENKFTQKVSSLTSRVNTTMNYTYQNRDFITHHNLNPNFAHLNHQDFSHHIKDANAKGLLTKILDKSIPTATNYHQGYDEKVQHHQFNRKQSLCSDTLKLQKGYGLNRYFRKFK